MSVENFDLPWKPAMPDWDGIPTQAELLMNMEAWIKSKGVYAVKRPITYYAYPAQPGEVCVTIINGKIEAQNVANKPSWCVMGPLGETWLVPELTFFEKYRVRTVAEEQEDGGRYPRVKKMHGKQWTAWVGKGGAIFASEPLTFEQVTGMFPRGRFEAPWGADMTIAEGDRLVLPLHTQVERKEIYKIDNVAFLKTYKVCEKPSLE